jgi:hypothetical protein
MSFQTVTQPFKKYLNLLIVIVVIVLLANSAHFQTEAGYTYYYQNQIVGKSDIYTEPGVHFKVPWFSRVTSYKQVVTVVFGHDDSIRATRTGSAIEVRFADTYTGTIPATFRYKLPSNQQKIAMIHKEFRTFENLVAALLIKTSRDVVVNTATQYYTGEEFFQGGFNQFKAALTDQLRNGIYKTERKRVEIEQMALAPIGLGQEKSTELQKAKTLVWKTVPVRSADGKVERLTNPLDSYGIEVTQITLGSPTPEAQLEKLLTDKKRLVADRIKAVQEQETAKEQAKTAQLMAEIERTKAKQEALKHKELAVIAKQREVEEARKQAEKEIIEYQKVKKLAAIDKAKELAIAQAGLEIQKANLAKELAIAQAEREIQKANFEAAQFEAKSIREKGGAEAEVLEAKYKARIPEIYLAEIQREIAEIIYPNLKGIRVTMPHNIVNLGEQGDKLQTNLDVLSSFATIGVMEGLEKKAVENK